MAVARAPEGDAAIADPRVDGLTLAAGDSLEIQAKRALTCVEAPLAGAATIDALPTIAAASPTLSAGESASIVVTASVEGQRYQLLKGTEPVTEPTAGDGGDLSLETGALEASADFVVEVSRAEAEGIVVVQRVAVAIEVSAG
jgi:hypothetical protein